MLGCCQHCSSNGIPTLNQALYVKKSRNSIMQWLMPSEGGYLEAEGLEKTWRIKQEAIAHEVDISSSRKQYDIILPGTINGLFVISILG